MSVYAEFHKIANRDAAIQERHYQRVLKHRQAELKELADEADLLLDKRGFRGENKIPPGFISDKRFAYELSLSRKTVLSMIHRKTIDAIWRNKTWIIPVSELKRYQ